MDEQKITLELNNHQYNIIMTGLSKLPIEMGLETFDWLKEKARQQLQPSAEAPKAPPAPLSSKVIN